MFEKKDDSEFSFLGGFAVVLLILLRLMSSLTLSLLFQRERTALISGVSPLKIFLFSISLSSFSGWFLRTH